MTTTSFNALFINDHTYAVPPSSAEAVENDADSLTFRSVALANVAGHDGLYEVGGLYRNGQLVSVAVQSDAVLDDALVSFLFKEVKEEIGRHLTSAPAPAPAPEPEGSCTCRSCVASTDPSQNVCDNCECVLHDWVHIYCLENDEENDEATFCSSCWHDLKAEMKAEGWRDQDSCSDDEDD